MVVEPLSSRSVGPLASLNSRRAKWVMGLLCVAMTYLMGRVAYLQTHGAEKFQTSTIAQHTATESLVARRGSIFDRHGNLLAGTVLTRVLYVDPNFMHQEYTSRPGGLRQMEADVTALARIVGRKPFDLILEISEKYTSRYIRLAGQLDPIAVEDIQKLKIPGVGFEWESTRQYPAGALAAHVLGGVGSDGNGLEGAELQFDRTLSGRDGWKKSLRDSRRRSVSTLADDYQPPSHGRHVVLTLDSQVQQIVEEELRNTINEFNATSGECVVMDPSTGDILALASFPTYMPESIDRSSPEQRTNRVLTHPYEPGSTIKPFIVAQALEKKAVRITDIWPIRGPHYRTSYGRKITDVHGYDKLSTWDVLVKSSNIGMSMIGQKMGSSRLRESLADIGFGRRSGVELRGEDAGILNPLVKWTKHSPDSVVQGYELLVTPLQMTRAIASIANGGKLVTPHLTRGWMTPDGSLSPLTDINLTPVQVLDQSTADEVRRILADVPVRGTAQRARSSVYNIFGKTGTAHAAVNGRYNEINYTASFIGGAPYESPRLVIAFVVSNPDKTRSHFGGLVAAPAAGRVLERSLLAMGVPPSPELAEPPPQIASGLYNFDAKAYKRKTVSTGVADVRD